MFRKRVAATRGVEPRFCLKATWQPLSRIRAARASVAIYKIHTILTDYVVNRIVY